MEVTYASTIIADPFTPTLANQVIGSVVFYVLYKLTMVVAATTVITGALHSPDRLHSSLCLTDIKGWSRSDS